MATVAERAKAIVGTRNNKCWNDYCGGGSACPDCEEFKVALIEHALLAERRLAMEEAAKIAEEVAQQEWTGFTAKPHGQDGAHSLGKSDGAGGLAQILRAAAEKEVGK